MSQASCVMRDGLERRCLRPLWLMLTLYTAISIRLNNTSPQSTVSLASSLQITHSGISSFSCSNLPLFLLTITITFIFCLKPISAKRPLKKSTIRNLMQKSHLIIQMKNVPFQSPKVLKLSK